MGYPVQVWGWTFAEHLTPGKEEWHYKLLYEGHSVLKALWVALWSGRHYGCVKMEMR